MILNIIVMGTNKLSLSNFTSGRNNNLDALRLLAAILVVFHHSFSLLFVDDPYNPFFYNINGSYGRLGVYAFFFISGFLITQSYLRSKDTMSFFRSRCLRIFPLLIVVILICAFVLGPLLTNLNISSYFKSSDTYSYMSNLLLISEHHTLPGVFVGNSIDVVNGPLWTLRYEFICYLLVAFLGFTLLLKNKLIILVLFMLSLTLSYFGVPSNLQVEAFNPLVLLLFFTYFSAGMLAYLYRDKIQLRIEILLFVSVLLGIAALLSRDGLGEVLFVFPFAYIILYFGYHPKINLQFMTKHGDFSYGIYIMGWPIQQTIIYLTGMGEQFSPLIFFLVCMPFVYLLGALSWHLIEEPALRLKHTGSISSSNLPQIAVPVIKR